MNLKERFKKEMIPVIQERLGLTNVNAVPKVTKVVINMGVGEAVNDKKHLESAVNDQNTDSEAAESDAKDDDDAKDEKPKPSAKSENKQE